MKLCIYHQVSVTKNVIEKDACVGKLCIVSSPGRVYTGRLMAIGEKVPLDQLLNITRYSSASQT